MSRKKKSFISKIFSIAVLLVVATLAIITLPVFMEYTRDDSSDISVNVEIPMGASEQKIASILKENGIINYEISFRIKMYNSPYRGKLNYGVYTLYKEMCLDDILRTLSKPATLAQSIKLTVPEGWSAEKIAAECERKKLCTKEEFLKVLKEEDFNYGFIEDIPENDDVRYKLEGYLFPSTHYFDTDADAYVVIDTLLGEFEKQYDKIKSKKPANMTMNEVIIRAALIEREAKLSSERKVISGVIQNRIDKGMLLQIDASVVYAISEGMYDVDRFLYKDLEIDSPYNTYKYPGLPVGAICNPGISSIEAAMKPEKHNYLYYHTDTQKNDGSHIFSETFAQHTR